MTCLRCGKPLTGGQQKWCSENCRKRACDTAHRGTCYECGRPLAVRSGWNPRRTRCQRCRKAADAARVRERYERLERWWKEGLTCDEIRRRLGWSPTSKVSVELDRARSLGYDLPYRYTTGERGGRKFPEQVR